MEQKACKSRRIRDVAVRLNLLVTSEAIPIKISATCPPKCELNRRVVDERAKADRENPMRPQPYTTG